jgi:hypothetical protein
MRLTIIVPDSTVIKDGVPKKVDLTGIDFSGAHALQWYEDRGEVEFGGGRRNAHIQTLDAEPWISALRAYDSVA